MKIDSIYIATVAHQEDGWLSPLAAFSGKQRTERFIQVQQGIYFPYKKWAIEKIPFLTENDRTVEHIHVLMVSESEEEASDLLLAFDSEEGAERYIQEQQEAGTFPYRSHELIEMDLD